MPRFSKMVLLTAIAFMGAAVAGVGVRLWSTTQRSVSTIFEKMTSSEEGALMCGNIDWVDKEFLLHRTVAAVILLFGAAMVFWALVFMLRKKDHALAA